MQIFIALILIGSYLVGGELENLLLQLQREEDLSRKTIQQSAGYVITFTREELDRMKIKSLKEILNLIPFLRYNEDAKGFTDLVYVPFQPTRKEQLRVYIDDKEVVDPLYGNGLQVFSEMDISYIDHIEIYMGAVSFTLGLEPSIAIIKLYTKDPARENISTFDLSNATYGTNDLTYLKAKELENSKYLLYLNYRNLQRKKYHFNTATLSRDKEFSTLFFKLEKGSIRWDIFASNLNLDSFTADALSLEPTKAFTNTKSFYSGLYFKKEGWKSFVNVSYSDIYSLNQSDKLLGIFPSKPFPKFYKSLTFACDDLLIDSELSKESKLTPNLDLLVGVKGRVKRFEIEKSEIDGVEQRGVEYDKEDILTGFMESKYLLNQNSLLTFSMKYDKYFEASPIQDYNTNMFRLGYIFNTSTFTAKLFAIKAKIKPTILEIFETLQTSTRLNSQRVKTYALELQKRVKTGNLSFFLSHTHDKDVITRDLNRFILYNNPKKVVFDNVDLRYKHYFNLKDSVEVEGFVVVPNYGDGMGKKLYGAHLITYTSFKRFDLYNSLVYKDWKEGDGLNYSFTLKYQAKKNFSLYLKGINVFNTALTTTYYGYNLVKLPDVAVYDRQFWIGMEYQF